jgi:hypothetical protein
MHIYFQFSHCINKKKLITVSIIVHMDDMPILGLSKIFLGARALKSTIEKLEHALKMLRTCLVCCLLNAFKQPLNAWEVP